MDSTQKSIRERNFSQQADVEEAVLQNGNDREHYTVESHLKTMKELNDRLAAIDAPISEEYQVVTLLGSLPKPYATVVTALETQLERLTLGNV